MICAAAPDDNDNDKEWRGFINATPWNRFSHKIGLVKINSLRRMVKDSLENAGGMRKRSDLKRNHAWTLIKQQQELKNEDADGDEDRSNEIFLYLSSSFTLTNQQVLSLLV